jgi:glycerol-3-phosphate O-acyltransferase / dihydroxyacetone phosphate acyltransferase
MNRGFYTFYSFVFGLGFGIYYKRFSVSNLHQLPEDRPVLLAANHSNAFLDSVILGLVSRQYLWYLARSDVFSTPFKRKLLHATGILPIYRQQDSGFASLEKNKEVFQTCYNFLAKDETITIFPEGNCFRESTLRPLKKGTARIAFGALEEGKVNDNLVIVCAGLNFDDPDKFQSEVGVRFSEPIRVADYLEEYANNKVKAVNRLTADLYRQLDSVHINIHNRDYNGLFHFLNKYFKRESLQIHVSYSKLSHEDYFLQTKKFAETFNEKVKESHPDIIRLKDLRDSFQFQLNTHGLRVGIIRNEAEQPAKNILLIALIPLLVISAPLFASGVLFNYLPFIIPVKIANKTVRLKEFYSSVNFCSAGMVFTIFYAVYFLILLFMKIQLSAAFALLFLMLLNGLFSYRWLVAFKKIKGIFKLRQLQKNSTSDYESLLFDFREIRFLTKKLFS